MQLGVSAAKEEVREAIASLSPATLANSFCRVVEDIYSGDSSYCVVSHADGAGTKSILAYVHYKLEGNPNIFRGIAQDAIVMNLDDLLCVGATRNFSVVSIINRNAHRVGGEVLAALVDGSMEFIERMNASGVTMVHCGGETADVGDIVSTVLVDSVLTTRMEKRRLVSNDIGPGQVIIGLAAGGPPTTYERAWNSGIGSNGLTLARHELLHRNLAERFPEVLDEVTPRNEFYRGPFGPRDRLPGSEESVLESLLSPTRTFAPVIAVVLREYFDSVSGIVHCSGGGQLKCLKFGRGIGYYKNLGDELPPIFETLKSLGTLEVEEMARVFNMGYRMEIYCSPVVTRDILSIAKHFNLDAREIGYTEKSTTRANELTLQVGDVTCSYSGQPWNS